MVYSPARLLATIRGWFLRSASRHLPPRSTVPCHLLSLDEDTLSQIGGDDGYALMATSKTVLTALASMRRQRCAHLLGTRSDCEWLRHSNVRLVCIFLKYNVSLTQVRTCLLPLWWHATDSATILACLRSAARLEQCKHRR